MLWLILGVMALIAVLIVARPLVKKQSSLLAPIAFAVLPIVLISAGLYAYQGRPEVPSGAGETPDIEAMVASLAERLEANPNDLAGWKMLGRSYMNLGDFVGAVEAYERAAALESPQQAQTLVSLGEALLARDNTQVNGRIAALFESALALEPNNPTALFYGGIGAYNRGDRLQAADRWEVLLGLNPPEEIRGIISARIAEWRGQPPPQTAPPSIEQEGPVVTVALSLDDGVSVPPEATIFIIARDPNQPTPPIAVTRRRVAELPISVELSDADSMIPGRSLSAFSQVEVVARVSVSGEPIAQSGDWFGVTVVTPAETPTIELSIDQQVP